MHCDVLQPALPVAGFLIVFGLAVLVGQRRAPRSPARLCLGLGSLLVAVLATTTVETVGCDVPPPTNAPRSATGISPVGLEELPVAVRTAASDDGIVW